MFAMCIPSMCLPRREAAMQPRAKPAIIRKDVPTQLPGTAFTANDQQCPICYELNPNWQLPCKHCFHEPCLRKWMPRNKTCPVCRAK